MFRPMRVRPPNGWAAIAWELAIVTAGVLIALFVQEWANERSWRARASAASHAVRGELTYHLLHALEYRLVEPCVDAQLASLARRLTTSGDRLSPAQLFSTPFPAVVRVPNKSYVLESWEAAISDGVAAHVPPQERDLFRQSRRQGEVLMARQEELVRLVGQLNALGQPLELTPEVVLQLSTRIEDARNVNRVTGIVSGQVASRLVRGGIRPARDELRRFMLDSNTIRHCRSERLPLRARDQLIPAGPR